MFPASLAHAQHAISCIWLEVHTLLAIAGNKNLSNIEIPPMGERTQNCMISTISYSSEIGNLGKLKRKKQEHGQHADMNTIVLVSQGTPREALYTDTRALFQFLIRRLIVRCLVSKPWDWWLELWDRFESWQAHQQQCCRGACRIWKQSDNSKYKSRSFDTLRDLTRRRLIVYWNRAGVVGFRCYRTKVLMEYSAPKGTSQRM